MNNSLSSSDPGYARIGGFRSEDERTARSRLNALLNGSFFGHFDHLDNLGQRLLDDDRVEGKADTADCLDRAIAAVMEGEICYFQDAGGIWVFLRPHLG